MALFHIYYRYGQSFCNKLSGPCVGEAIADGDYQQEAGAEFALGVFDDGDGSLFAFRQAVLSVPQSHLTEDAEAILLRETGKIPVRRILCEIERG